MILPVILLGALGVSASPLGSRGYPAGRCVSDVKIESCGDFECRLPGYHRIDTFLTQSENTSRWNYVFYQTDEQISERCVTDIRIVAEGAAAPEGAWYPSPHSAHEGVTTGGGPRLYSRRDSTAQYAGDVVDLVILKAGRWTNRTEEFWREPVNLGLGEAAGQAAYEEYREFHSVSSGWVYLEYTKAGQREPITDVQLVSCPQDSIGADCGIDLLKQGWTRRDVDLNGPTANGSHVYLFTLTENSQGQQCVTGLSLTISTSKTSLPVNVNEGNGGNTAYLEIQRKTGSVCLTSIIPLDSSLYLDQAGYEIVRDAKGNPANVNDGVAGANSIYIFTSTEVAYKRADPVELAFNATGGFRVALFSDLHYSSVAAKCRDIPEQLVDTCTETLTAAFMGAALDLTNPDLVVINGDLFAENARKNETTAFPLLTAGALTKAVHPMIERGVPFTVTWGNHDAEGDLVREELQRIMDRQPGFAGSRGAPELDGIGTYKLDIKKCKGSDETKHHLWFFDSRSYTYFAVNGSTTGAYGEVEQSQIAWYQKEAEKEKKTAMAFFHIPLGQISGQLGLNSSAEIGVHGEDVCAQGQKCTDVPDVNKPRVGLFEAFLSAGNVKATFSGHDHNNDYVVEVQGIKMVYDGSAGYTAYSAGDPNYNREMRVIDVTQWGESAVSYKLIDDILAGTVHRNQSEPVVTLF